MNGLIIKIISNNYTVKLDDGEILECSARGVFRNQNITPLVGDYVVVDTFKDQITDILDRKNELVRPPVANIDIAVVVVSAVNPDFNTNLLDKMIDIIEFNNIKPVICISKYDLLEDTKVIDSLISYYKKIGYQVFINKEIEQIEKLFEGKLVILTGQSGVGKSTLVNSLDSDLELQTNEISFALGRGKHTTRHVELYEMYGGYACDTPGFSKLDFIDMTKEEIRDNFIEFNEHREKCKYKDCMHINEDDCEVKRKVNNGEILYSRYDNYKKFIESKEVN